MSVTRQLDQLSSWGSLAGISLPSSSPQICFLHKILLNKGDRMVYRMVHVLDVHGDRSERYSPPRPLSGLLGRNRSPIELASKNFPAHNAIKAGLPNGIQQVPQGRANRKRQRAQTQSSYHLWSRHAQNGTKQTRSTRRSFLTPLESSQLE